METEANTSKSNCKIEVKKLAALSGEKASGGNKGESEISHHLSLRAFVFVNSLFGVAINLLNLQHVNVNM